MNPTPLGTDPARVPLPILSGNAPPKNDHQDLLHRRKRLLAGSIYGYCALWGAHNTLAQEPGLTDLFFSLALAAVTTLYCVADSQIRARPIVFLSRWLLLPIWPIALPLYLLGARGRGGWWRGILAIVGFVATYALAAWLAWLAMPG